MKPSQLTATIVREELEHIINRYPHNTGMVDNIKHYHDTGEEFNDPTCVYFTDQDGQMVTPIGNEVEKMPEDIVLTTPVCIVGMWIESFHPEFKENEVIRSVLIKNATIRSLDETGATPWDEDVQRLLYIAQDTQDRGKGSWKDIDLDVHPDDQQ